MNPKNIKTILLTLTIILIIVNIFDYFQFSSDVITINGKTFHIQIADNNYLRRKGLSNVRNYPYDGMLFVFKQNNIYIFQSMEMQFPLVICSLKKVASKEFLLNECFDFPIKRLISVKGKYIIEIPKNKFSF
ncbi:hypothetical protein FHQ18_09265 [Deferribacter autotrophicus]|uniref:DUF192 domain-containing protein n=1 Tax=Deferribacter autotrophicus TaxID=500465 RepID=A0A5A8F0X8_9BACT|nr:DUF192 domain-containing protein [Deferribacter autotrophicus]KAA0257521.1 hypothetical protein FHQ18_09265 [Deferribacter autotrophicus]